MASSMPKGYNLGPTLDQKRQLQNYLDENEAKGAPVHSFNPDASPQEKAAIAGKAQSQLQSVGQQQRTAASSIPVAAAGTAAPAVPTVTIENVDAKLEQQKVKSEAQKSDANGSVQSLHSTSDGADGVPGQLPASAAPAIPDWYKIGWREVAGQDTPETDDRDKHLLASFIGDQYFGDWYHNAAVIVVAIVVTHFLTLFRFGWGWIFILMAFCATYYSMSIRRVRRRARDDIQRELAKNRLATESETADWMNTFLERFWLIYEPVLSRTIVASVEQILSASTPAFLDSLRLSTFSLGTKAPHIDEVRTHVGTAEDVVLMEWGISFTPNDVSDITPKQAAKKINPKIVLEIRVGKGVTAAMPILLEDITFQGKMKIRMKLMTAFPHIQMVDLCFMEPPHVDFVLKPIGGETFGFDIANIPGLSTFIREMVHATLGPMMYEPHVFTLNLEQLMSGVPRDTSIGVLQVTVVSAQGLKGVKFSGGDPDPYVAICINNDTALENTRWKQNTRNPHWQETKFILLNNLSGVLNLKVLDFNTFRQHDELGLVAWDLAGLAEDATQEGVVKHVLQNGKPTGELKFDLAFYPILKPQMAEGILQPLPETSVGIVRLVIHQAKELDPGGGLTPFSKDINPYCKIILGADNWIHSTPLVKRSLSPVWESAKEFLCADRDECTITVKAIDDRDFRKDPVIGYLTIRLNDLLEAKKPVPGESVRDWWPLSGCKSGRVRMSAEWKPLDMAGSLYGAAKYQPPIGIVRMLIKKAVDVKNVEGGLGGKSDPYVRVLVQNTTKARTEVMSNNLNPVWDQYVYIPVHSLKENMFLECMDYQHLTKDRSLGVVGLDVADLAVPAGETDDPKYPYRSLGVKEFVSKIRLAVNSYKGDLHYTAEFIPAVHLKGVSFGKPKNQVQEALDASCEGEVNDSVVSEDHQKVPQGVTVTLPKNRKDNATGASGTPTTANGNRRADSPSSAKTGDEGGVEISKEELLKSPSGVIVFDIISGRLARRARLEILMDDGYWPVFGTPKARSTDTKWDMVGEGFIKELDFGRVWLRLNESDDVDKEDITAEFKSDAKQFLERALNTPTEFELYDKDGARHSVVTIAAKFVPVPIVLSPRESINNQGSLRVVIFDGKDIPAVDRAGTSDPYVQVTLNGEKVYKTEVKKKSLTPVWNENFTVTLYSRVGADFSIGVYDWDQIGSNDLLGTAKVELADLEPFIFVEKTVYLQHAKLGNKASIRLRFLFTPEVITKSRKPTSTFSTAGRAMTQIGAAPVGVSKSVVSGVGVGVGVVGGVVGKNVMSLFKKEGSRAIAEEQLVQGVLSVSPDTASDPQLVQNGAASGSGVQPLPSPPIAGANSVTLAGTLRVEVLGGHDLMAGDGDQVKPYVIASVGETEHKTKHVSKTNSPVWNESLTFQGIGPETNILHIEVFDHKTIGKDKPLGDADVEIWKTLQPNAQSPTVSSFVNVDLRQGFGKITLRLEFEMNRGRSTSIHSSDHAFSGTKSRFALRNISRSNVE